MAIYRFPKRKLKRFFHCTFRSGWLLAPYTPVNAPKTKKGIKGRRRTELAALLAFGAQGGALEYR